MGWPRTRAHPRAIVSGCSRGFPNTAGIRKLLSTCQAVSTVSYEYHGPPPATHSPQPTSPSLWALTSTQGRRLSRPKLVSKGSTSGSSTKISSTRSSFIAPL